MFKRPFELTSVEEDFKILGIISGSEKSETLAEEEDVSVSKDETPETLATEVAAADDDEDPTGDESSSDAVATEDEEGDVDEARAVRKKIKRGTGGMRAKWRTYARRKKGRRKVMKRKRSRTATGRKRLRLRKGIEKRFKGKKRPPRTRIMLKMGLEDLGNLISESQEIANELMLTPERKEAVKSFANIAIISELLAKNLEAMGQEIADDEESDENFLEDLSDIVDACEALAEDAAGIAEDLNNPDNEVDSAGLEEEFKQAMSELLDGLEMYSDLTEKNDDDEDEDDEDDDEDDDEEYEAKEKKAKK